jgi:hypothetical protein
MIAIKYYIYSAKIYQEQEVFAPGGSVAQMSTKEAFIEGQYYFVENWIFFV